MSHQSSRKLRDATRRKGKTKRKDNKHNRENLALAKSLGLTTSELDENVTAREVVRESINRSSAPLRDSGLSYKQTRIVFEKLLELGKIFEKFDSLDYQYYDQGETFTEQQKQKFKQLWESNLTSPFPDNIKTAIEEWEDELNNIKVLNFSKLKKLTGFPGILENDSIEFDITNRFSSLETRLKARHLPVTAEGFNTYIKSQLKHFAEIREKLIQEPNVVQQLWDGKLSEMIITFTPFNADEHGFAPPSKIELTDGLTTKSLVYKSRIGEIDKLVTDLFSNINKLLNNSDKLPTYKQEIFSNGHLLSEFVNGQQLDFIDHTEGIANSLDQLQQEASKRDELERRIKLLEYVSKAIGLTDLHGENVIYDETRNQIIPIDLEAFSVGTTKETGLYGLEKAAPKIDIELPSRVTALIEAFNEGSRSVERRFVPVPTSNLSEILTQNEEEEQIRTEMRVKIAGALEKSNFKVNGEKLEQYINEAINPPTMLIPSFTIIGENLYSSPVGKERLIVAKLLQGSNNVK